MRKTSLTIFFTFVASVVAVVACGPNGGGKVPIGKSPLAKKSKDEACLNQFGRHGVRVSSKTMKVDGKAPVLEICEAEPNVDYTPYTRASLDPATPAVVYKRHRRELSYQVGKVNDVVTVLLSVGIEFQDEKPRGSEGLEASLDKVRMIDNLCVREIENVWKASSLGKVSLKVTVDAFDYSKNYDQILTLKGSPAEAGKGRRYIALLWPDRGQFIPEPPIEQGCSGNCRVKVVQDANLRFCANFALLVGQWLGLKAPVTAAENCSGPMVLATGGSERKSDYMESGDPKSANFWKTLRFSRADLKKILEPACRGKTTAAYPDGIKPKPD